jgi:sialate O-acetylesterase
LISFTQRIATPLMAGATLLSLAATASANVVLPNVLGSHMVLQRGMAVPIWGKADPNEKITVAFRDQQKTTTADAQGKWMVKLDALQPGEPATLTVTGNNTITLSDVLVGEVWLGSGQSNMETHVSMYAANDPPLRDAASVDHPQIRIFGIPLHTAWQEASPEAVTNYSAQLFYFGVLLQKELKVPIGLLEGAQGGTPSIPFISQAAFDADPAIYALLVKWDAENPLAVEQQKYEAAHEKWKTDVAAAMAALPPDAASPAPANNPSAAAPAPPLDKAIRQKYPEPQPPILAVNTKTGNLFESLVRPMIPFGIRGVLWDQGESGTGIDKIVNQPTLMSALIRSWREEWGQGDFPWIYVQKPSGKGCALDPTNPINVGCAPQTPLPPEPPGHFVFGQQDSYAIMAFPNTFIALTTDLAIGIHPPNKSGYATRDSQVAFGAVYGEPVEYYGPMFQSGKVDGGKIEISFTHVGKGLTFPMGQKLQGFAIAGEDQKFHWADTTIDGATVVVSSPQVPAPLAVRYWPFGWADLFNGDGLPASGFRTDSWKL